MVTGRAVAAVELAEVFENSQPLVSVSVQRGVSIGHRHGLRIRDGAGSDGRAGGDGAVPVTVTSSTHAPSAIAEHSRPTAVSAAAERRRRRGSCCERPAALRWRSATSTGRGYTGTLSTVAVRMALQLQRSGISGCDS